MTSPEDVRATGTRPFATTMAAVSEPGPGFAPPSTQEPMLPEVGDVVGMHYRLVRLLGEGNFGKVYVAARIDVPEHRVALKILPRSFYIGRNVERELVMLATVGHPHVVQLKDHGTTADYVWLTMPVYEGETLEERLKRGPLDLRAAYDIFLPIARALEALHAAGLRHQDVKPDNIFLAQFGQRLHPVLLDLGVAAECESNFVAGTALFAAPEQLSAILDLDKNVPEADKPTLSEKMDTYCFAATLLLALVGDKRFPGAKATTRKGVRTSHQERAKNPLTEGALPDLQEPVRGDLERCLARWMAMRPEDRPNISEVANGLEILLEPEREAEREEERARAGQKRSLARARIAASVILVGVLGVGGLALWKRETLRLASELEDARARGAESFDKLDTCVASHAVARREAYVCGENLGREKGAHERTLDALSKQGAGCGEAVEQIREMRTTMATERKQFEDDLRNEQVAARLEREKLIGEWQTERSKLEGERQTCRTDLTQRDTSLESMRVERDTCIAERDAAAIYEKQRPGPVPTGSPPVGPGPTPTGEPTAQPPPPPTPEPPPPPPPPTQEPSPLGTDDGAPVPDLTGPPPELL